ncbi:collagen alpha-1(I) chain-like [Parus major]|uniref:collagen alpha-1(I) chain-like n=1 Tax=Parus major TaxID=9157 RepID=UPI00077113D8|nr:collagen alpha-1(I) chain-like [Parus major]
MHFTHCQGQGTGRAVGDGTGRAGCGAGASRSPPREGQCRGLRSAEGGPQCSAHPRPRAPHAGGHDRSRHVPKAPRFPPFPKTAIPSPPAAVRHERGSPSRLETTGALPTRHKAPRATSRFSGKVQLTVVAFSEKSFTARVGVGAVAGAHLARGRPRPPSSGEPSARVRAVALARRVFLPRAGAREAGAVSGPSESVPGPGELGGLCSRRGARRRYLPEREAAFIRPRDTELLHRGVPSSWSSHRPPGRLAAPSGRGALAADAPTRETPAALPVLGERTASARRGRTLGPRRSNWKSRGGEDQGGRGGRGPSGRGRAGPGRASWHPGVVLRGAIAELTRRDRASPAFSKPLGVPGCAEQVHGESGSPRRPWAAGRGWGRGDRDGQRAGAPVGPPGAGSRPPGRLPRGCGQRPREAGQSRLPGGPPPPPRSAVGAVVARRGGPTGPGAGLQEQSGGSGSGAGRRRAAAPGASGGSARGCSSRPRGGGDRRLRTGFAWLSVTPSPRFSVPRRAVFPTSKPPKAAAKAASRRCGSRRVPPGRGTCTGGSLLPCAADFVAGARRWGEWMMSQSKGALTRAVPIRLSTARGQLCYGRGPGWASGTLPGAEPSGLSRGCHGKISTCGVRPSPPPKPRASPPLPQGAFAAPGPTGPCRPHPSAPGRCSPAVPSAARHAELELPERFYHQLHDGFAIPLSPRPSGNPRRSVGSVSQARPGEEPRKTRGSRQSPKPARSPASSFPPRQLSERLCTAPDSAPIPMAAGSGAQGGGHTPTLSRFVFGGSDLPAGNHKQRWDIERRGPSRDRQRHQLEALQERTSKGVERRRKCVPARPRPPGAIRAARAGDGAVGPACGPRVPLGLGAHPAWRLVQTFIARLPRDVVGLS